MTFQKRSTKLSLWTKQLTASIFFFKSLLVSSVNNKIIPTNLSISNVLFILEFTNINKTYSIMQCHGLYFSFLLKRHLITNCARVVSCLKLSKSCLFKTKQNLFVLRYFIFSQNFKICADPDILLNRGKIYYDSLFHLWIHCVKSVQIQSIVL